MCWVLGVRRDAKHNAGHWLGASVSHGAWRDVPRMCSRLPITDQQWVNVKSCVVNYIAVLLCFCGTGTMYVRTRTFFFLSLKLPHLHISDVLGTRSVILVLLYM